jgi:excisionase family DNA binding protein
VTERFVRRLVFERRIPFLKVGHFVRFEPAAIERWIVETRVPEAPRR